MDDDLRMRLNRSAAEEVFLDHTGQAENAKTNAKATKSATSSPVSLMITSRQRAELRQLGFSENAIRQMTPAEAHEKLGLAKPF